MQPKYLNKNEGPEGRETIDRGNDRHTVGFSEALQLLRGVGVRAKKNKQCLLLSTQFSFGFTRNLKFFFSELETFPTFRYDIA